MSRIAAITPSDLPALSWRGAIKIRWGQCDAAGMVYTPNYFDIFNGLVEDWFTAALGLDYYSFMGERKIGLGYAHVEADFLQPGFFGETLDFVMLIERIGGASFSLILHGFKQGAEAVRGRLVIVATSLSDHRPIRLPEDLRRALVSNQEVSHG